MDEREEMDIVRRLPLNSNEHRLGVVVLLGGLGHDGGRKLVGIWRARKKARVRDEALTRPTLLLLIDSPPTMMHLLHWYLSGISAESSTA